MNRPEKKTGSVFTKKKVALSICIIVVLLFASGAFLTTRVKIQLNEIFKLNGERKSEGYYLTEFEFKMLGIAYFLDKGQYIKGLLKLNELHEEFKTKVGLLKIPPFSNSKEKLNFYKSLQNPRTGAFMDDSFPLFTYIGPTSNMIAYISEDLAVAANEPFCLKYPLKFLDEINRPDKLVSFLNDTATVGWIGSKLPKTPFVEIGELVSLFQQLEQLEIYSFSPEWKQAFIEWCYENQDPGTGLWGSKWKSSGKLLDGGNLTDTEKILNIFMEKDGTEIDPDFPLRKQDKIFSSTLGKLSAPMPADLSELHVWILDKVRGLRVLTRYLWKNASLENKEATKTIYEDFIKIRFKYYFVESENSFSLYPDTEHADLDGTGEALSVFKDAGVFDPEKQARLWGDATQTMVDLGTRVVAEISHGDLDAITENSKVNSIRIFRNAPPDRFDKGALGLFYPRKTDVPDILDLLPKLRRWIEETPQNMGNWVRKEDLLKAVRDRWDIDPVPILNGDPLEFVNHVFHENGQAVLIGFDILQIPRCTLTYKYSSP